MDHSKLRMAAPLERQPIVFRAAILLPFLLLILLILFAKDTVVAFKYHRAEDLAAAGEYQQAATEFASLQKHYYKDTEAWEHYCRARLALQKGHLLDAKREMDRAFFHHLDEETAQQIEAFRKELAQMQPPAAPET